MHISNDEFSLQNRVLNDDDPQTGAESQGEKQWQQEKENAH